MMKFKLLLFATALIILIAPAKAQSVVVDRMSLSEETVNPVKYKTLDKQLRVGIDFGYSIRTGKFVDDIPADLKRQMRSGINFGADLIYFPVQEWGIGAKFNGRVFNAESSSIRDEIRMFYFAPMGIWRLFDKREKNAWVFGVSIGYLQFKETVSGYNGSGSISKGGIGSTTEVGYDIRINNRQFIGLKLSLTDARVQLDTGYGDTVTENASSIDFSIGIRF